MKNPKMDRLHHRIRLGRFIENLEEKISQPRLFFEISLKLNYTEKFIPVALIGNIPQSPRRMRRMV